MKIIPLIIISLLLPSQLMASALDVNSSRDPSARKKFHYSSKKGAFGTSSRRQKRSSKPRYSSNSTTEASARSVKKQKFSGIQYGDRGDNLAKNYRKVAQAGSHYQDLSMIMKNGKYVGYYKVGAPYKIDGIKYFPQEYGNYEEVGMASWYGKDFDGKMTANGEIYDLSHMTAAHRTLPMPSVVKVTNLENSKSVIVRVNDRGPFAKNRIIDMSKKAAQMLDYKDKGVIMVKVELLKDETRKLHDKLNIN